MTANTESELERATGAREAGARGANRLGSRTLTFLQGEGLLIVLALLVAYFAFASEFFLTTRNVLLIGSTASALGIMAVAQTFLIISGGVDLSVGSVLALTGVSIGLMHANGVNLWVAAGLSLLIGLVAGAVNGFLAVTMKINPLIVSLGMLSVISGLAVQLSNSRTLIIADKAFNFVGSGRLFGIPFPLILFGFIALIGHIVQSYTAVGRAVYAIGGNAQAARISGIAVARIQFWFYVLSGLSAALAGVVVASQLNAGSPTVGANFLLSVVTAVILGGTSLSGGIGAIKGTLIAVFVLQVLQNGFGLVGYGSSMQTIALGVVLIVAVLLDQFTRRSRA